MEQKKNISFITILIAVILSAIISMAGSFVIVRYTDTKNRNQSASNSDEPPQITAVFIKPGSNETFPLTGGYEMLDINSLEFLTGSKGCADAIEEDKPQIMDALQTIIVSKGADEVMDPEGLERLKDEISDAVDQITGFTGDKALSGILKVYLYVETVSPID
uniref:Flagellar protein FliL n=1 Tax=Mesoaciditoga lauensis TaxID=1495039 RepID=A0A7V3VS90_9BACT